MDLSRQRKSSGSIGSKYNGSADVTEANQKLLSDILLGAGAIQCTAQTIQRSHRGQSVCTSTCSDLFCLKKQDYSIVCVRTSTRQVTSALPSSPLPCLRTSVKAV